ncbi:MAG TPA: hypothetical protein VMF30_08885, partial [Pirellulales bacterium]|nr:hypothetical protein [Pirellulales bacterium]
AFLDIREGSNVGYAQPINFARKMLEANSIPFDSGSSSVKLEGAALTRRVVPAVAYIGMTMKPASDEWRKLTYTVDMQASGAATHRSGATTVDTSGGIHDEGGGDLMMGLLGSIGFEPLGGDSDKGWQTQRVVSFTHRTVGPSGPGPPQQFGPHGLGGRSHRRGRLPTAPNQGQNTTEQTLLGAEVARYEIVNTSSDVVTVKKISRFATQPAGASKVPYLIGEGEGSFEIDTSAGCIRSYSFTTKLVVEGNAAAPTTLTLTYQRMVGNTLASLPPLRPEGSPNSSPGSRSKPRGGGPQGGANTSRQPPPVAPVEVPPIDARAKAEGLLDDLYEKELAAADTSGKRIDLARTLKAQADDQRPGTADHYVMLEKVKDLAMLGGNVDLTFQAIDQLATFYRIDAVKMKAGAIASLAESVARSADQRLLVQTALDLIDQSVAADDIEGGRKLGKIAFSLAKKLDDKALLARTSERAKAFKELQKSYEEFHRALATLKSDPKDAPASAVAGKYYCFVKDDWKQGLPLLAQGDDSSLAASAAKEVAAPTDGPAIFALAEAWDDLADKEQGLRQARLKAHARVWYQKSLPLLSGLARKKAEKSLSDTPAPEAVASTSGSRSAADASPGSVNDRQQLIKQLSAAVRSGDRSDTKEIGSTNNKIEFSIVPEEGALLIGFDVAADDKRIVALRPIFFTSHGQLTGKWCGATAPKSKSKRIVAKSGYAVGAMKVKAGLWVDGFSLVFMEIGSEGLNTAGAYESDWLGRSDGARSADRVGGDGCAVIGVHGHADSEQVTSLGLVLGPKK